MTNNLGKKKEKSKPKMLLSFTLFTYICDFFYNFSAIETGWFPEIHL